MSQPGDIGAARISLIVDASDYESALARGKNAAVEFGNAAEKAFDLSSGKSRTAQKRLLDYVSSLGSASTEQQRFLNLLSRASGAGAQEAVLAAATKKYNAYQEQVALAAIEQKKFNDEAARTASVDALRGQLQEKVGGNYGGMDQFALLERQAQHLGASNELAPYIAQLRKIDQEQRTAAESARLLANAFDEAAKENAAFDRQLEKAVQDATAINARIDSIRTNLQEKIGAIAGVGAGDQHDGLEREAQRLGAGNTLGPYIAQLRQVEKEQRDATAATQAQVAAEIAVETEARAIHAQWVAIERQIVASTTKMNSYDLARANAVQQFGPEAAAPLIKQINQFEKLNKQIHGTTVNTNQLRQAIRFLPAQFTDIGVSLAGGMNPLLVAFQQGGQIFNQFQLAGAGTSQTLREIGKYALGLVNPMVVAGVAVAGLAYAGYDAAKAMEDLSIASANGFGVAGNAESLYALTESLNKMENIRLGPAEQAVARLAASGRLAGENFDMAAEATARWSSLTGEAADRVAGQFEAIGKDPLQAIESGVIRVTQAQYEQVKALVAVGDEQGAINAITKIWYDTINNNSAQVEAHLSGVSRYMQAIKDGFGGATRAAGEYFNSIGGWMADYEATYQRMVKDGTNPFVAQIKAWDTDPRAKPDFSNVTHDPLADPARDKRVKAQATELATYLATADEKAQRQITINRIIEDGKRLQVDYDVTAGIISRQEKAWKDADAKKNKSKSGSGGARSASRDVRYDYQLESALLQTQGREVQAQYAAKKISAESYYGSLLKLAQQEYDIQKRSNAEQLAAIGGKKGQEHEVARLRVADALAEQTLAQRTIDINSQQAQYLTQLDQERRAYNNTLRDGVQAQQEEYDVALNRATMGAQEFERWSAENALRKEESNQLRDIRRQVEDKTITVATGAEREQAAIQATNDKLAQTVAMYARLDAATADWSVGVNKAWSDWQVKVGDASGAAEKFTTEALQGFADQTTNALTGNLTSWGDYFDGLARMITQFIVEEQLTKWIKSLSSAAAGGGSSGGGGGSWGSLFGSILSGLFGGGGGDAGTFAGVDITGQNFAEGGQAPANSLVGVNERGFELANIGSRQYMLTGSRPVQITPNHKIGAQPSQRGPVTIQQTFVVQGTPNRATRDQMRRDIANATQRSVAKV